ncbi:MAG TPA: putative glycolipid-binding domain-containing protein [Acidimicrobiia bacterium]|jgi:hypothetical protein
MSGTTYVWRRLDLEGLVFVRLDEGTGNVSAAGYEICADGAQRWAVRFAFELDRSWRHERTTVEVTDADGTRRLEVESDDAGSWLRGGRPDPFLEGCTDVDLAGNPFTNAFVTRRLAPDVGTDVEVRAAFIETPSLSVRPLVQRYERLAADRWAYADDEYGRFEFGTDARGVAVDYQQLAERV